MHMQIRDPWRTVELNIPATGAADILREKGQVRVDVEEMVRCERKKAVSEMEGKGSEEVEDEGRVGDERSSTVGRKRKEKKDPLRLCEGRWREAKKKEVKGRGRCRNGG